MTSVAGGSSISVEKDVNSRMSKNHNSPKKRKKEQNHSCQESKDQMTSG